MHTKNKNFACKKNVFGNVCLRTKIDLRLKKKQKKFWANSKFLFRHQKKCQSYNFHIWELYDKHFFQKIKIFIHSKFLDFFFEV